MKSNLDVVAAIVAETKLLPFPSEQAMPSLYKKGKPKATMLKQYTKARTQFCKMISQASHNADNELHISWEYKRKLFGREDIYEKWNTIFGVFTRNPVANYSTGGDGYTARPNIYAFRPSFKIRINALIDDVVNDRIPINLKRYVAAAEFYTDEKNPDLVTFIEPNIESMKQYLLAYDASKSFDRLWIYAYIKAAELHKGVIPQFYRQAKYSDRFYNFGPLAIQNKPKAIRNIVTSDYNKYDLNAACFACLVSLFPKGTYPVIENYVLDTKATRNQIQAESNNEASIYEIKEALNAMAFGSPLQYSEKIHRRVLQAIKQTPSFKALFAEWSDIVKVLTGNAKTRKSKKAKYDYNAAALGLDPTPRTKGQLLSETFHRIESRIMQLIRKLTDDPEGCLLVHDELITKHDFDVCVVESIIQKELNVTVRIKKAQAQK